MLYIDAYFYIYLTELCMGIVAEGKIVMCAKDCIDIKNIHAMMNI